MSDEASEATYENQNRLAESAHNQTQEEQITKPAPKAKPQREKDPKKVAAGKKLAEKNRQAKAALDREVKREREIAEKGKEKEKENSPEMSFQTVLSIAGIVFTAIELYQRFRQKDSSTGSEAAVQSPISPITEPKQSGAPSRAPTGGRSERSPDRRSEQSSERSPDRRSEQSSERSADRGSSGAPAEG